MRRITKLWTTLLLLCVVGVANAATEYEIDQKFTTLAELDGNFFAIADETAQTAMGIGVSGHNNGWDMYFGTYTETYAANACYYKLEAAQGDGVEGYYYLRTYKADGNMYTAWGNTSTMGFFNSQAATGTCCFALGVSDKNGQDITNGAVWAIEASEGKFALKNIGTGLYLHSDNLPAKYEDAFYFTFCTLKEKPNTDPLADQKDALTAAIAKGGMINALAYTEATFATVTAAVSAGETALADAAATAESLTSATTAINDAIAALAFKEGFSSLKDVPFGKWSGWGADAELTQTAEPAWSLFTATGQSYGDPSVNNYADLSAFDKLYVTVASGTPRILLNRDAENGQWNATEAESHLIDNTVGEVDSWHKKYFTTEDKVFIVDLKQLTTDKGFAHLHSIKSKDNNVVTGLYLYKEGEAPAEATTVDWVAGEQGYENTQDLDGVAISIDGKTTMTCTIGTGSNGPKFYTSGSAIRTYGGNVITFKGEGITKIIITGVSGKVAELTANTGELTTEGIVTTWKGEADEIVLTNSTTNQQHIAKLHVVYGGVEPDAEPVHIANTAETAYTVAKAIELIDAGDALDETVFVKGTVSKVDDLNNGAITYWISADGTTEGVQFECYKGKGIEGADFAALEDIEVGAEVIVTGKLAKYQTTYELSAGNALVSYKAPVKPVIAEGTYYLYNVGGAGYLVGANSWGTRASISKVGGLEVEAVMTPEGKYELKTASLYAGKHLGFNGYVDNGDESNWTITPVEGQEGVYTLTSTGTNVLFWDGGEATTTSVGAMPETAVNAYWKIISSADRLAQLATASAENPVDATFLISNPNFGRNASNAAWTMDASNQNLSGGTDDNKCAESFHAIFTLSQVLAKAPAGKYELKAQGFYRQDDGVEEDLPVFYANDKSGAFPAKTGAENSMNDASASFTKGEYTIEPFQFSVFEDGQLTIGAKGTATHQWVIFDNFQLTYLTSEIPADEFKPAYEEALAAAQAALANETYASITGDEKAALEKAIADNTTVEETMAAYKAAISALNAATSAFTGAKADYEALATAKTGMKDLSYQYAAADKKAAAEATLAVEATSAADAKEKAAAIEKAYRQYAESNALLEGVEGSKNMTEAITNPNAQEAIADPWAVVLGEGSGGSLGILDGEPLTDGEGNSAYKYFDGGNWGAQAWDVSLQQKIALPAGKYQLTVSGRASADVDLQLFAGEATAKLASIGATGGLFGRGWGDASVEFELAEADSVLIGVRGVTEKQHNWMSFTRFRLMQFPAAQEEIARIWDFTKWSDATVANLKADAAASKTSGWSDVEKKADAEADAEPTEASKDNCFWLQLEAAPADGVLTANGVEIAELKGLLFTDDATASSRNIAIAVNYPVADASKDFGPYAGGAYFWVGGKDRKFTIPNVAAGSTIIMEIESHKITDGRGVKLMQGDAQIGDAFQPKAKESHTWTIENAGDVAVVNTNGCHIYTIKVVEPAAPVVPDEPELVAPEGWTSEITNGNLAGDDVSNYVSKEYPSTTPVASAIVAGAGKNGSRGILVKSQDKASQPWDSQFWIKVNEQLPAGTKVHVEFDYKADKAGSVGTQTHGEPGSYLPGTAIGNVSFTTEWQHFSGEFDVATESNNMQSIAFNLNDIAEANNFYFDNFGVWVQKPKPVEKWADLIVNGDMEGESMECFYVTEQGVGGPFVAVATEGIGKDGGKAVKVQSADKPSQDWDTQFFVRLPYELPAGTKFKFSFDYKASNAAGSETQSHNEPGQYIHWACAGSPSFTTEWQNYEYEGIVPSECDGSDNKNEAGEFLYKKDFQTIAFNLAKNKVATAFIFDNVKFEVEESIVSSLTKDPAVDPKPYPVGIKTVNASKEDGLYYDLQGRRVAKPARGLYIINGKKVMVK